MSDIGEVHAAGAEGDLAGRSYFVTGAGSGIGFAAARRLSAAGADVVLVGRSAERLETAGARLPRRPVHIAPLDVADAAALAAVRDTLDAKGVRLSGIVANAGVNVRAPAVDLSDADLRRMIDTNLVGTFETLRTLLPLLTGPTPSAVVTSSMVATYSFNERAVYAATKAAVSSLVRSLALEWGPRGIRVNAVGPGIIRTAPLDRYMHEFPERIPPALAHIPLGRFGEPEDVAEAIAWLLSDAARYVTGQTLIVDGGMTIGGAWW